MSELKDLYQEIVLDHGRRPRNFGDLAGANRRAAGSNPLCGDRMTIHLRIERDRIERIRFEGSGCLISIASCSLMTHVLEGKSVEESAEMARLFGGFLTGGQEADPRLPEPLRALGGVREFPVRVKCATLPWQTLMAALEGRAELVSTE
jgi:nitrogen fixation NifU-like protein